MHGDFLVFLNWPKKSQSTYCEQPLFSTLPAHECKSLQLPWSHFTEKKAGPGKGDASEGMEPGSEPKILGNCRSFFAQS